jgi:branched-subunit amino acid transport protein
MTESGLWLVILGMGAITYGLRAGSLLLAERLPHWAWLGSFLRFVPVAVLSAIVALETALPNGTLDLSPLSNYRLLAAALAILVAWRTRRMLPTILVGMATLWILQALP